MIEDILVSVSPGETRVACLARGQAVELHRFLHGRSASVGTICLGRVTRVVPAMGAAFVEIGASKAGFLPLTSNGAARTALHEGARVVVQITREPEHGKGAQISTSVRLPGHFLVYLPTGEGVHVSRRIDGQATSTRLIETIGKLTLPGEGWIARTNAAEATEAQLASEAEALRAQWVDLQDRARHASPPALIQAEPPPVERLLRDKASAALRRVVVDDAEAFVAAGGFLRTYRPELAATLARHDASIPLFEMEAVEAEFESVRQRRVSLPSGGSLAIERTEALWAIDVNTGRNTGGTSAQATILATNIEAAVEIARQIRLRDLGGLIVVDFVHMDDDPLGRDAVLQTLNRAMADDPVPVRATGFSDLGLVELSRRRSRPALDEDLEAVCPTCDGSGFVQVPLVTALAAFREAARSDAISGPIRIAVPPQVAAIMETPEAVAGRRELSSRSGVSVEITTDSTLAPDRFRLD